ncbi:MAG: hypothetical protein EOP47_18870 [Sphingobacteriaceae bacterium]|nr:MAG: hypothetical protein EOP47_18870 [Sphingobacteriaceae bacterium]
MFTPYSNRNIATLFMVRHGWVNPEYELTDKVYSYGKLRYKWISARRRAFTETANENWQFRFEGFWKTSLLITNNNDEVIGKLTMKPFKRKAQLLMNNGFAAAFRRTSFWRSKHVWESDINGPILRIHCPAFSSTDHITVEQSTAPADLIPLLVFLGIHLIIISKQREAVVASS